MMSSTTSSSSSARAPRPERNMAQDLAGTVAVVGFPNVGKSTLVNRLTGSRAAVVHETPGVTRDRKELICEWAGTEFRLIDTGGVDIVDPSPITRSIADQARSAVAEADLVLFVVDAQIGITPGDEELAAILREARKPVFLLANKIDDPAREEAALEFHRLGLGDPIPLSAMHGHGTGDLLDAVVARLRRKRRQRQGIEYYSELRALDAADRADIALVLVDASEGLVDQDLAVADVARRANDATLVVLSKWDIAQTKVEDVRARLEHRLRQRPGVVTLSAKTGRGVTRLLDRIEELFVRDTMRISTPVLNDFLQELRAAREPPSRDRRRLNLLYGTQTQTRPPRFRFFVNDPGLVTRDYGYWVENQLRERFGLEGVPVSIDFVRRS